MDIDTERYPSIAGFGVREWASVRSSCDAGRRWQTWQCLPAGLAPATGRLGFERAGLGYRLLLEHSEQYRYDGQSVGLATLVETGRVDGPFGKLVALVVPRPPSSSASTENTITDEGPRTADVLTDLDAIDDPYGPGRDAGPDEYVPSTVLAGRLTELIVGQDAAAMDVAEAVAARLPAIRRRGPLVLLFHGESGIGKTEMAIVLAKVLTGATGREWPVVRVDLNQYTERHSAMNLLGAPPSFVGHGQPSILSGLHGAGVLLLDEIEKAHPDLWTSLMTLFDTGHVTLNDGSAIDISRWTIVATSNLLLDGIDGEARRDLVTSGMPSAVVNRIDRMVRFGPLGSDARRRIAVRNLVDLVESYGLNLRWAEAQVVAEVLADTDHRFGARDISRAVERRWSEALARYGQEFPQDAVELRLDVSKRPEIISIVTARGPSGLLPGAETPQFSE